MARNYTEKYQENKAIGNIIAREGDSQFWKELLKHRDHFTSLCKFAVGDGGNTRFWEDWWIGSAPLFRSFPRLYNICFDKQKTVREIFDKEFDNVTLLWKSLAAARVLGLSVARAGALLVRRYS